MSEIISQQGQRFQYDAIVIGSGIAGLCYALRLAHLQPDCKIALITKTQLDDSSSLYAQGGIAAVTKAPDSIDDHVADTVRAGDGICYVDAVERIIQSGPECIDYLISQGVEFSRAEEGNYALTQEGGHSARRIFHNVDQTGRAIIRALIAKTKQQSQIHCFTHHGAVNLILANKSHQPGQFGEVIGTYVLDEKKELTHTFLAKVVVLATGGAGKVYRYSSNPEVATGDGIAMAYRAGASVGNMEFYQFHPTLLYHGKLNNLLLTEALRGEGGYLRLPGSGERFMKRYSSEAMELATRDVVARAIFTEVEKSNYAYVHLDLRHKDKSFLMERFPYLYNRLLEQDIDMASDLIPVVPAAHYLCGGILTDQTGRTDLTRLYAIGETACSGFHGANRLASNSLLEAVHMALEAATASETWLNGSWPSYDAVLDWDSQGVSDRRRASQINAHWRGLRGEMTSYAGIIRTEAGLKDLLKLISTRSEMIEDYYWKHTITRDLIELRNIVTVAELIVKAALSREESRGGHFRADFPQRNDKASSSIVKKMQRQQSVV